MIKIFFLVLFLSTFVFGANECVSCHGGIEHIRAENSGMMKAILEVADKAGHAGNDCIVCHGGNPKTKKKNKAHSGTVRYFLTNKGPKEFYPAPGNPFINQNSCGICHENQVNSQMNSLMMSELGDIQSALWSFGTKGGYKHEIGTYKTQNPTDPHVRVGTKIYQEYMTKLSSMEPQGFPQEIKQLPKAPTAKDVQADPSLAVYTYLRQEQLYLNTASQGKKEKGAHRGTGCSSCHIPYSNEGYYEGNDGSISKKKAGHLLVHSIQSSRETKVKVQEREYSGVPVETCTTCHNRGKSIGTSYQGLMESSFGDNTHKKQYMHMQEDIHFQKGMLCQDCHTSNDLHGDGFLSGANAGAVEIECQDCHGTTKKYPWELPFGVGDEFNTTVATGKSRGTTKVMVEYLKQGSVNEPKEGYLLSARGNPLIHAVKEGNEIIIHLANGKDIKLQPLKKLKEDKKLSQVALLSMDGITAHDDTMECYTCHASWAPQFYGGHLKIDYSKGKQNPDYLAAGMKNLKKYLVDAEVSQSRSFLRWEDPALAQNGEGRISPIVPGFQAAITVIGKDSQVLLQNHIYKIPNGEGGADVGQNAIAMSPIQPHTIIKGSRSCESCHTAPKAMGMGITGLKSNSNLPFDYSRLLDESGTQLQTVGNHWKLSAPLSKAQRNKLNQSGMCLSCHQDIPSGSLAVSAMTHMSEMADIKIDKKMHADILNKLVNLGAWVQVLGGLFVGVFIVLFVYYKFLKKKKINPRNQGWK